MLYFSHYISRQLKTATCPRMLFQVDSWQWQCSDFHFTWKPKCDEGGFHVHDLIQRFTTNLRNEPPALDSDGTHAGSCDSERVLTIDIPTGFERNMSSRLGNKFQTFSELQSFLRNAMFYLSHITDRKTKPNKASAIQELLVLQPPFQLKIIFGHRHWLQDAGSFDYKGLRKFYVIIFFITYSTWVTKTEKMRFSKL